MNMEGKHSVSSHLRLDIAEYDRIIRTYIPYYDESREVQLDLLAAANVPRIARIIDLGGGTGSLAESILDRFPRTSVIVRDIDPEMLEVARTRLARFAGRVELSLGSFADPLPTADAVLSAFALHHVSSLSEKAEVYRQIHQAIRPGGVILNNDAAGGPLWPFLRDQWAGFMVAKGFTMDQAYRNLDDWAAEDTYFPVYEELQVMVQAGFEHPECFWRRGPVTIVGALV
jgi:tRNA (cmo5U34)-methyltransferase